MTTLQRKLIAGNWKMNGLKASLAEARAVAEARESSLPMPTASRRPTYLLFLNVLLRLQWAKGSAPIIICTEAVGAALGRSHDRVSDWIIMARDEGLLDIVERAIQKVRCGRYRLRLERFPAPGMRLSGPSEKDAV